MPGTLMYECCLHTLRVFLLRAGWVAPADADVHVAPVVGNRSQLRCRGQVTPTTRKVRYRIDIKEIGCDPEPYVLADASMFVDDLHGIEMEGMSLRYAGTTGEALEAFWQGRKHETFDRDHVLAFASGKPSDAFGPPYAIFDSGKRMARLPRPPFSFVDRIRATAGTRWRLAAGAAAEARYDVTPDAWYFGAGRSGEMPYAVLLEVALQPCGWLAAYLGAALRSDDELFFRNLEGDAVLHRAVRPDEGELSTRCTLESVAEAGGMILLQYRFATESRHGPVLTGTTRFGFFPEASLAQQAGIGVDAAAIARPAGEPSALGRTAPLTPPEAGRTGDPAQTSTRWAPAELGLPAGAWQMLDRVALRQDGGPRNLGMARGLLDVDRSAWFFEAHFFQDPVMPGSLGVEAFLQLVQRWLLDRHPALASTHRVALASAGPHRWVYRGQVRPHNRAVEVVAHVTALDGHEVKADGFLLCDGQPIYSMRDFALRLVPKDS
jgi:3-hydroxymyristoyl/3-hydroxydecanoyl-(acyl carrier protein) dehydratase